MEKGKSAFKYDKPIMTINPKTCKAYISIDLRDLLLDEVTLLTFINGQDTMQVELQQWKINDNKINSVVFVRKVIGFYNKGETFRLRLSNDKFYLIHERNTN
jgi:hypothetical protein